MKNYDGPSFYKKEHPKVEPIKKKKKTTRPKYSLPKEVRTREERHDEAEDYMETPSLTPRRFRSTQIPTSLQHLNDWEDSKKNQTLIKEIKARLHKNQADYLLFEKYLPNDSKRQPKPKTKPKPKSKATVVQEKLVPSLNKPNSGLHRSLSKIIAEDQEALENGKNKLNSLFAEDE